MSSEKIFPSLILILILALAASVYTEGFSSFSLGEGEEKPASPEVLEEAKQKALEFINSKMVQPGTEVEIKEISEEGGLYKLSVSVNGRDIESYMTKDLALFFPSPQKMAEVAGAEKEAPEQEEQPQQEIPKSEKPEVLLFTMSYCPYGNQAEGLMKPVAELLGDAVEIEPHYILYENYEGGGPDYCIDDESKYCSMHGIAELNQDLRELCVYNNQRGRFWDFIEKANSDCTVEDIETCWKDAAKAAGVNTAQVESCFAANSLAYARAEKELSEKEYPVQNPSRHPDPNGGPQEKITIAGSPTLVINGMVYDEARTSEGYKNAICGAFESPPESCGQVLSSTSPSSPSGGCGPQ